MDKKIVGLAGALAAFSSLPVQASTETYAATPELTRAKSFSELLDPIPNALALLKAIDSAGAAPPEGTAQPGMQIAQSGDHHHHHHHRYYRKPYIPPHHHHHYRYYYDHHHHNYHHHSDSGD